ncbi:ADP-ribosylation factor-binding protein Gga2p [Trichomonascus vanleenenianus]|uniref:ubiquitin-binding protein n=1 Tax=Trichomonascus vanleenenianus TaxID=2268995 RepID=UPI003ECA8FCD
MSFSQEGSYTDRFRADAPPVPARVGSGNSARLTSERLNTLIERACSSSLLEPNLALNLEIADMINLKKGSFPREAAVAIVKLINSRAPNTPVLALGLLDICVKNCGYPFHLQISRKEFLNELVRRFPEKPPHMYTRTQQLILQAIEEWRETICKTSRYREDLGYVRDMHRLLSYKGYIFPEVDRDDAAVLNPSDTLKSAAELEQEERDAQSAKLQELIRRGTPRDLQEANHLMSVMAGFRESTTDYRAKAAKDLDKVRRKAEILEEMLKNVTPGQQIASDDVFSEIVVALKNATPKIQKMIDDEGQHDEEAMVRLLGLNDYIHSLITKYDHLKRGEFEAAAAVQISAAPTSLTGSATKKPDTSSKQAIIESLIDIDDEPTSTPPPQPSQSTPSSAGGTENLIDALDGLSFGNIALGTPSRASPKPVMTPTPVATATPSPSTTSANLLDDEWTFSSAAPTSPQQQQPAAAIVPVLDSDALKIEFAVTRNPAANRVDITARYTNNSTNAISNVNFQLAVPRSLKLTMNPQSSANIGPLVGNGITQEMSVSPDSTHIKLRWKVNYTVGATPTEHSGLVDKVL